MIKVKITGVDRTIKYLNGLRIKLPKAINMSTEEIANNINRTAKMLVRYRTRYGGKTPGNLTRNIHTIKSDEGDFTVIAESFYAGYVEYGTKAHEIPNAFGRKITVSHPGAKPMFFMRDAVQQTVEEATGIIERRVREALKG